VRRRRLRYVVAVQVAARLVVALLLSSPLAHAAVPSPAAAKRPRMLLDAPLRAAWQAQVHAPHSPVARAIALCSDAGTTDKYDGAQYQGSEWAKTLQACLVAWGATGEARHAATSIRFFTALIDDLDQVGDKKGGDKAGWRDSGYAIRMLGPYTALAYDWLYDQIAPDVRARARQRWSSWTTWYREHGYRARAPGNNYQAGYLIAATLIAIAEAGEGDPALWSLVTDELWAKDMASALASGGILDGGDWAEGWQYGPLSVAEYALATRIAARAGIPVAGVDAWLAGLLRRHVYALSPGDKNYAGGDTEAEEANLDPALLTLDAIALGDAPPDDRRWARGEIARLGLHDDGFLLYDALAAAGDPPRDVPRLTWPTWYETQATGTIFARTRWDDRAVWFVAGCTHSLDVDHRHPDAGNFVLSRGKDDAIVDPSPYGSASTLTGNAPTIASGRLPVKYAPSQGVWSTRTGWDWATQTRSGVLAARCDYTDQFRFQDRASDVPDALRDLVLLPSSDGGDASLVVVDRAATGSSDRAMYLRFRVPGELALDGGLATRTIGATRLAIASVARSSGQPAIGHTQRKDCFSDDVPKGRCDAARFPVSDLRLEVAGPSPSAVHVISVSAAASPTAGGTSAASTGAAPLSGDGWAGVRISSPRDAVVVWPTRKGDPLAYRAPRSAAMTHVILDPHEHLAITARPDGDGCAVSTAFDGTTPARPAIVTIDDACRVVADPATPSAAASLPPKPPPVPRAHAERKRRFGCSAADPGAPLALAALGLLAARRRRVRACTA
jgi:MYXO-CTERM domain-containing protein